MSFSLPGRVNTLPRNWQERRPWPGGFTGFPGHRSHVLSAGTARGKPAQDHANRTLLWVFALQPSTEEKPPSDLRNIFPSKRLFFPVRLRVLLSDRIVAAGGRNHRGHHSSHQHLRSRGQREVPLPPPFLERRSC